MNLGELINATADDLMRNDLTAQCSDAVVMAIRHYDRKRWWFAETSATFTTTSTTNVYVLASDFRDMDYMEIRYPGNNWQEVKERDFALVRQMLEGQNLTGYPEIFAIRGESIHLAYQPNADYPVRYYYTRALGDLTAGASNAWTTDCKDLIRASAARTVALRTLHDPDLAAIHATIEQTEYMRLSDENERRVSSGKVKPCY